MSSLFGDLALVRCCKGVNTDGISVVGSFIVRLTALIGVQQIVH